MTRWPILFTIVLLGGALLAAGCSDPEPAPPEDTGAEPARTEEAPSAESGTAEQPAPPESETEATADPDYVAPGTQAALDKAVAFLRQTQLADGGWSAQPDADTSHLGITCVATLGLVRSGLDESNPVVAKAVDFILDNVHDDGGIYTEGLRNYCTSISLMVLSALDNPEHKEIRQNALAFLQDLQWDEGEGLGVESADFGGAGYGKHKRPDMSNQQWFIQAVREAGLEPDDPAVQKALVFVERSQGGEAAEGYWIGLPDGGFIYTPHDGGESKAGEIVLPSGEKGLKAYGSMTYAGFLSLIYAGLDRDDPRVQAALDWVRNHWTLEENPELGMQGYYYYLMTMGKALKAFGKPVITDERGLDHPWRKELSAKLVELQNPDGSWTNATDRWYEGIKPISTGFALIALNACRAELQ